MKIMISAYQYLFEIENTLRSIVKEQMQQAWGPNWENISPLINKRPRRTFHSLHFHDLIAWYRVYPPLDSIFPQKLLTDMVSIIPIRNKIAHCRFLSSSEYKKLESVYYSFFNFLGNNSLDNYDKTANFVLTKDRPKG
ncbi:hypothetical protein D4T97_005415 [Siminovitchia acidinfaciens]|uniref:Swt1-like HEPN domain-containing protein n=1 Tax=Siminovitchia acidinfaciens TaxID=2321395 RepID=A0A429Y4E3_9BACI|nr:hypothetical protein [Siminovitchia acidinfaciens]RST76219.1 hypothetical protein D4T97_005415 [Siminovitchia acidinfaciens]